MSDRHEVLDLADEIEQNERELFTSGGGYQWEHLGDATHDIHALIRGARDLAAALAVAERERAKLRAALRDIAEILDDIDAGYGDQVFAIANLIVERDLASVSPEGEAS
jgi:hypothetical protein